MRANIVCPHRQVRIFALRNSGSMSSRPPAFVPHTILRVIEMVLSHQLPHWVQRRPQDSRIPATLSPIPLVVTNFSNIGSRQIPILLPPLLSVLVSKRRILLYDKYINFTHIPLQYLIYFTENCLKTIRMVSNTTQSIAPYLST